MGSKPDIVFGPVLRTCSKAIELEAARRLEVKRLEKLDGGKDEDLQVAVLGHQKDVDVRIYAADRL